MAITNRVFLAGRLAAPPELNYTPQGIEQCIMRLAHNWKDKHKVEQRLYMRVVCYGAQAKACIEHLTKGSPILVEGPLRSYVWEDKKTKNPHSLLYIRATSVNFLSAGVVIPPAEEYPGVETPDPES